MGDTGHCPVDGEVVLCSVGSGHCYVLLVSRMEALKIRA